MAHNISMKRRHVKMNSTNFFLRSSRISVNLLSYESIPTDKREQYSSGAEKNLDGKEEEIEIKK